MDHVKLYNDIRVPANRLIRKRIPYSNPAPLPKQVTLSSLSPFIKLK